MVLHSTADIRPAAHTYAYGVTIMYFEGVQTLSPMIGAQCLVLRQHWATYHWKYNHGSCLIRKVQFSPHNAYVQTGSFLMQHISIWLVNSAITMADELISLMLYADTWKWARMYHSIDDKQLFIKNRHVTSGYCLKTFTLGSAKALQSNIVYHSACNGSWKIVSW